MTRVTDAAAHRPRPAAPLELWSGFECTFNRVGDEQHDQLAFTGHYDRLDDLDRIAALGVRTLRYPVIWERFADGADDDDEWIRTDRCLERIRQLGMDPIVGLVHHGSGPRRTSLVDDGFAKALAAFAGCVAARYPWVTRFTPINEPLTTARFSTLYGFWYPHLRDDRAFFTAMLNQVRATRLAMAAIRAVTPDAVLVQTEDLGRTHATRPLTYQAELENDRRWLTVDLLTGRVQRGEPVYEFARSVGITGDAIADAMGDGCVPGIVGINNYVTSERWLDHRLDQYPLHTHGQNGRHRYADVEAVRGRPDGEVSLEARLMEAWQRYGLPMAVTETHLGGTREQQMRWLHEAWRAAKRVRAAGADLRAVTAWAALGLQDWSSLVTRIDGDYEPGLFDVRAPTPRPTALATMVKSIAATGDCDHAGLAEPGWWQRPERLTYTTPRASAGRRRAAASLSRARPILIVGASGTLGSAFQRLCMERGLSHHAVGRSDADVADCAAMYALLRETNAWAVVNAAGYVRVDDAERERQECRRGNVDVAGALADACAARAVPFVTFSSDLVFDGSKGAAYIESDAPSPLGVYGASKVDAEARVLASHDRALVIRTAAFFGPWDDWNFVTRTLATIAGGGTVDAAHDLVVSPTYVPDLVHASLDLLLDGERGRWHLANTGSASWSALGRMAAEAAGLDSSRVRECDHASMGLAARRPANVALSSERGWPLRSLEHALARYVRERPWDRLRNSAPPLSQAHSQTA